MLAIQFYPADLTPYQEGPDWFDALNLDVPLYFALTNSQLSGKLSPYLSDFEHSSPYLGHFRMGYTDLHVCQWVPLSRASSFFLLGKDVDGHIVQARQLSQFLRNVLFFGDEHALLQEALFEIKKKHQLKELIPVGYVVLESYYWH